MTSMIRSLVLLMVASGIMFVEGNHEQIQKQEIVSEVAQIMKEMLAPMLKFQTGKISKKIELLIHT